MNIEEIIAPRIEITKDEKFIDVLNTEGTNNRRRIKIPNIKRLVRKFKRALLILKTPNPLVHKL